MSLGCLESPASVSVIAMHGMRFVSGQGAFTRFPGAPFGPTVMENPQKDPLWQRAWDGGGCLSLDRPFPGLNLQA